MKRVLLLGALIGSAIALVANAPGVAASESNSRAGDGARVSSDARSGSHRTTAYRRKAQRPVKVYINKRGGYSYSASDIYNTYSGDSRDPMLMLNRQTPAGPFDSGFFFDSPVAPRGGYSPYLN